MRNYKPRRCTQCGKEFNPKSPVTKYCFDCRTFICECCGKKFTIRESFIPTRKNKFCSMKCYLNSRWHSDKCPICGNTTKDKTNRYCSDDCRKQANIDSAKRGSTKKKQYYKDYKAKLYAYLGNKCQLCGFDNVVALDIHHPNGKDKHWKRNQNRWVRYWKERKSIQLICSNCHRIIHHSPQET